MSEPTHVLWGSLERRFLVPVDTVVPPGDLPLTSMFGEIVFVDEAAMKPWEVTPAEADAWLDRYVDEELEPLSDRLARMTSPPRK